MSSQEPEKPKSEQDANWLRRQAQHGRAKETGDTIAAQVGEGAQNVAVGKNIIQIGSIQVPRWLAFAVLGLLAIGVVVGGVTSYIGSNTQKDTQAALTILQSTSTPTATPTVTPTPLPTSTPTPTPTPQRMNGDFNLVVGQFGQTDSQGNVVASELGTELSLWLARRLNRELTSEDVHANLGEVLVWNDDLNRLPGNPLIGVIHTEEECGQTGERPQSRHGHLRRAGRTARCTDPAVRFLLRPAARARRTRRRAGRAPLRQRPYDPLREQPERGRRQAGWPCPRTATACDGSGLAGQGPGERVPRRAGAGACHLQGGGRAS